ncbi:NAD(P)-dependent oxidoreductase [Devosia rhodophyticola]|uniref:NAD(P)-dependent oxidoreductase n=1 Tax=Devosia rhodophyticola TaxID=3026423 RepID=A0ABY7YTV5_9HYPH|nr:NAD(P)-dependent oxidoreductase [Devosia rhodophyticola]WDR04778.1 NAD(P)-dependent oxidoreductase [Devosia rhodophyticola]
MTRIVFLDTATLPPSVNWRQLGFPHDMIRYDRTAPGEVAERIADADIVITNKAPIDRSALAGATRLKLIAIAATGMDNVDVAAAIAAGVAVVNVKGYAIRTVPEHTMALMLALKRSLVPYRKAVLAGRWQQVQQFSFFDFPIGDLAGSCVAIIGSGTLGSAVARLCEAFGMRVVFAGRRDGATKPGQTPFYDALAMADVISLHCPLTDANRGLLGSSEFDRMDRQPLIINTARGGLIDEIALEVALDAAKVSGAGLDVTAPEPPPANSTIMRLAQRDNVILTPHTAWASQQAVQGLTDILLDNIERAWGEHRQGS